jgi:LysR family hydrogen peroxide-inducible transcriptional activator
LCGWCGVELYQVRYFVTLCETLNFARAAERCNVSQPSLTRAVQKLERELGGVLILRERRRTSLTKLGQQLRPIFEEVLSQTQRAKSVAEQHLTRRKTVLQLGIISSVGLARLAPLLGRFGAEHLGFELQLVETSLQALEAMLFGGQLDAAIVAYTRRPDKRLRYDRLYQERVVAVAPKGHVRTV